MARRKVMFSDGSSELGGYDVGFYPLHHFTYIPLPVTRSNHPLHVEVAGDDEWVAGCYRYRRNSSLFSLEFVRDGDMVFIQNGKRYEAGPGALFMVHRGADTEMSTGAGGYCRKKVMIVSGSALPAVLAATRLDEVDLMYPSKPDLLDRLFTEAAAVMVRREADFINQASAIAYRVLVELAGDIASSGLPPLLLSAVNYMEQSLDRRLVLEDLCRRFQTSQPTMHRLFKQYLGKSPIEYFIQLKMDAARQMLQLSNYSIKEISQRLGYNGQLYFSSEFRKRVGCSPRDYRATAGKSALADGEER